MAKQKRTMSPVAPKDVRPAPPSKSFSTYKFWLIALVLLLVTGAVYWQVRHFEFVKYDDDRNVSENRQIQRGLTVESVVWAFTTTAVDYWRPLTWLSHMLDWQIYGANAGGHHLTNVFLHLVNTLLLLVVLRRMTGDLWRSAFVAGIFALHPLHVGSVAWVTERKDVLSVLFWMLTMLAYVRYVERPSWQRYLPMLLWFALGLMAKPIITTLPFVLLLLDVWPLKRFALARSVLEKLPLLGLAAASAICTVMTGHKTGQLASAEAITIAFRLGTIAISYARYLGKTFWPVELSVYYPLPPYWPIAAVAGAVLLLAAVSVVVFRERHRRPYLMIGWLWFLGTLVPVIGVTQGTSWEAIADRHMYLPLIGLSIMAAWSVSQPMLQQRGRKLVVTIVALVTLAACAVESWIQTRYWKNSLTLFSRSLEVTTDNVVALNTVANALVDIGRTQEAIALLTEALRLKPDYGEAHSNLAIALAKSGKTEEALTHCRRALELMPFKAEVHNNMAIDLLALGRTEEATRHFQRALALKPDLAGAHVGLGNILLKAGKLDEAVGHFEQALSVLPADASAHRFLGDALAKKNRTREAIRYYERALQLKPGDPDTLSALGIAECDLGQFQQALPHLKDVLLAKPNSEEAHTNLGNAYLGLGRLREAAWHYEQALEINPDHPEAHSNLAIVESELGRPEDALRHFREFVRIKPDSAEAHYNLGSALFKAGQTHDAICQFEEALELKPDFPQAREKLAKALAAKQGSEFTE